MRRWFRRRLHRPNVRRVSPRPRKLTTDVWRKRTGLAPLPGAREWVTAWKAAGWRQAIATSAPRANAEVMLRALDMASFFDAVVVAEDVTAGKSPDPEVFLTAAARLEVDPARAIVVEDAATGVEGARRARMKSVGVNARRSLDADVNVASLVELPPDAFDRLIRTVGQPSGLFHDPLSIFFHSRHVVVEILLS